MKKAFTISETIMVIIVLGVFAIFAMYNMAPSNSIREKKYRTQSHNFYSITEGIFQDILYKKSNGDITKIVDSNDDKKIDSVDLKNHFSKYMDGAADIDCSQIAILDESLKDALKDASCAEFNPDTKAGFFLDTKCETDTVACDYLNKDDSIQKQVEDSCGYIIYAFRGSRGELGKDLFLIPFGKRRLL